MCIRDRTGYGLGFSVGALDGDRLVGHSGAQSRVSTILQMLPDRGVGVVVMCNLERVKLGGLAKQRDQASLSAVASEAYRAHLEPHHNWVLKSTFRMAFNAMPKLDEFFMRLGAGEAGIDRDIIYADMADLVAAQQHVIDVIGTLLVELELEKLSPAEAKKGK